MTRPPAGTPATADRCPRCGARGACIETRSASAWKRRRYECRRCVQRWTTREVIVHVDAGDEAFRGPRRGGMTERSIWA